MDLELQRRLTAWIRAVWFLALVGGARGPAPATATAQDEKRVKNAGWQPALRGWTFWCGTVVYWYHEGYVTTQRKHIVERVQTGVRMEKRLLKVLRALADYHDMTLGDLLEGIVLHAFDGKCPFGPANRQRIRELKKFYGLDLDSRASHRLVEAKAAGSSHE